MKIDINYKFKTIEGKVSKEMVVDEDKEGNPKKDDRGRPLFKRGPSFTLRSACLNVLINPPVDIDPRTQGEKETSAEDKLKWADLAQRIYKANGPMDLSADEIVLLKEFINKRYRNPLTVSQAYAILDPTSDKKS